MTEQQTAAQDARIAELEAQLEAVGAGGVTLVRNTPTEQWVSVEERMPEPGEPVLLDIGKRTPIRAEWVKAKTLIAHGDCDFGEYDEAADDWYWPEGWYEWNEHEETHWAVTETALNWMPLPAPPQGAAKGGEHAKA